MGMKKKLFGRGTHAPRAYLMGVTCPGAQIPTREGPCGEHAMVAVTVETAVGDLDALLKEQGWLTLAGHAGEHTVLEPVCPECGLAMVDWLCVQAAREGATDEGRAALAAMRATVENGMD